MPIGINSNDREELLGVNNDYFSICWRLAFLYNQVQLSFFTCVTDLHHFLHIS